MNRITLVIFTLAGLFMLSSCKKNNDPNPGQFNLSELSTELVVIRNYVPENAVIAHRGSTFWTPEETEAAYRWARNMGADYLEADLQLTSDGVIIALHDVELKRTTNIEEVFPDRADSPASAFTYDELLQLDAGSWFNEANPEQAREGFVTEKQTILTLEDLIMIAQGMRLKRDPVTRERIYTKQIQEDGSVNYIFDYEVDKQDAGHRPGIYIETKEPSVNPGIEQAVYQELDQLGWNILTSPAVSTSQFITATDGKQKVNVGHTNGKVILQTFSKESMKNLKEQFYGQVPTCFLLWLGDGPDDMHNDDSLTYVEFINFGIEQKAVFFGPSISGAPNDYAELLRPWQADLMHQSKASIHAYSFDTWVQMDQYYSNTAGSITPNRPLTDGMFTNRAEMTLDYYIEKGVRSFGSETTATETLNYLGY